MSNDGTGERKVALITGAGWWPDQSPGLGWALGAELAEAGYRVVLSDREIEPAERAAADLVDKGFTAEAAAIDVTDDGAVARAVDAAAARHGRLDAVVNAAALTLHRWGLKPFHEISAEQCQQEMAVTLVGALNISRAAIPHLLTQGAGNLIFVASVLADEPAPRQAIYGLCKAALKSLTASLAAELGPQGIRVNAVSPGVMKTRVTDKMPPKYMDLFIARSALRRISEPREIAAVVRFLVSEQASYVNGQTIKVDGGGVGVV
jgi:NAD(P)-dependent dehydrogenase (short-subunit alcohol dehydrogenase family)